MSELRDRIIRAHGGETLWREVAEVMASVSLGGVEFFSRFQFSPLRNVDIHLRRELNCLSFSSFPEAGTTGMFTPDKVWVECKRGKRIAERECSAAGLAALRHRLLWDRLDVLRYAGTLIWQALHLPFALLEPGLEVEELGTARMGDERWQRLLLRYPSGMPAVAAEQVLYADPTGLIRRADHSPTVYGNWLRVSQCWDGHESVSGLVYATRRSLHPCLATGQVWRLANLLWLELDDISVVRSRRAV